MNNQARKAVENSIQLELKKDGLSQRQNGDWTLRFTVAAIDMDHRLTAAVMGTRYQCVIVEISDDETPVDHAMIERGSWADLGATKQAGIRCSDPVFWVWLEEERGYKANSNDDAAAYVRQFCCVASRSELAKDDVARMMWHQLDNAFQAWKALENA